MCGDIESNEHFLMICPRYSQIRGDLLNALRDFIVPATHITAQLLLYGDCELSVENNISLFNEGSSKVYHQVETLRILAYFGNHLQESAYPEQLFIIFFLVTEHCRPWLYCLTRKFIFVPLSLSLSLSSLFSLCLFVSLCLSV